MIWVDVNQTPVTFLDTSHTGIEQEGREGWERKRGDTGCIVVGRAVKGNGGGKREREKDRETQTHTCMGVSCIFQEVNFKVEETEIVIISFGG